MGVYDSALCLFALQIYDVQTNNCSDQEVDKLKIQLFHTIIPLYIEQISPFRTPRPGCTNQEWILYPADKSLSSEYYMLVLQSKLRH